MLALNTVVVASQSQEAAKSIWTYIGWAAIGLLILGVVAFIGALAYGVIREAVASIFESPARAATWFVIPGAVATLAAAAFVPNFAVALIIGGCVGIVGLVVAALDRPAA